MASRLPKKSFSTSSFHVARSKIWKILLELYVKLSLPEGPTEFGRTVVAISYFVEKEYFLELLVRTCNDN